MFLCVNSIRKNLLFHVSSKYLFFNDNPVKRSALFSIFIQPTTYSTISQCQVETVTDESIGDQSPSLNVLRNWGCSENDISQLLLRRPTLYNAEAEPLQSKLSILTALGLSSEDLVKIIHCRPRFLSSRLDHSFEDRIQYFTELFGSKDILRKAVTRNPSLLLYNLTDSIKPVIQLYEDMGLSKKDLITMLLSRPTLIPRTSFGDEKLEYIRKSGVRKDSKMYKFVVTLIGISRLETIRRKVANFEKFGLSDDEVWGLFGRCPYLLTLSVDKIQRNMTFILGMMRLPASVVLKHPALLLINLEAVIKPRVLLAGKLKEMGLSPQMRGNALFTALRMRENRFLNVYVTCHPKEVADELMEFYNNVKGIKRLAVTSKINIRLGFPF
ncbi:transcription termination factor MTERF8, chloroplastic-like [Rutidosis leptorrhynchoides]|uniref:transcription termination factor MTERF8, chloroplastic-like n=1 Tax=Rutidosis leptorrhynchoides TaxID=125765 RepID=UPI003A99E4F1